MVNHELIHLDLRLQQHGHTIACLSIKSCESCEPNEALENAPADESLGPPDSCGPPPRVSEEGCCLSRGGVPFVEARRGRCPGLHDPGAPSWKWRPPRRGWSGQAGPHRRCVHFAAGPACALSAQSSRTPAQQTQHIETDRIPRALGIQRLSGNVFGKFWPHQDNEAQGYQGHTSMRPVRQAVQQNLAASRQ